MGIYVDDLVVIFGKEIDFQKFFEASRKKLNIVDNGQISKCLSMSIIYNRDTGILTISQEQYVKEILEQFELSNCKPVSSPIVPGTCFDANAVVFEDINLYQQIVGSLLYLANSSRPDICFAVNVLSRYATKPTVEHYTLAKRVLRYLSGTADKKLTFERSTENLQISIYAVADFGNEINDSKSLSGGITFIGKCPINWFTRRQRTISTCSCESEVNSILGVTNKAEFLYGLVREIGFSSLFVKSIVIFNDNQSAKVSCITNGRFNANKNYRIRLGRIREAIRDEIIVIKYCPTEKMIADLLTKPFTESKIKSVSIGKINLGFKEF